MRARLVTIPLSHYCERARWALDLAAIDYDEEQHLQFFAVRVVRALGGRRTVPALATDEGVLLDSGDILRWASARARTPLYPEGARRSDVEALDHELAGAYGVETRRLAYDYFFRCIRTCLPYNMGAAPRMEAAALRLGRPFVQPSIECYIGLDPARLETARSEVMRTLDRIDARLADGRPYLTGDHFTAADLTFATLTSVLVLPAEYPVPLPPIEALDEPARALVASIRERSAGGYALRLYRNRPAVCARLTRPLRIQPPPRMAPAE